MFFDICNLFLDKREHFQLLRIRNEWLSKQYYIQFSNSKRKSRLKGIGLEGIYRREKSRNFVVGLENCPD